MKNLRFLCSFLCVLCIGAFAAAEDENSLDDTLVAIIADTHVNGLPEERLPKWVASHSHQAGFLCKTVAEILSLRPLPANVIGLGDYAFLWGSPEDYALVDEILEPLERAGIRVTLAVGDHDRRDNFLDRWPRYAETTQVPERIVSKIDTPYCEIILLDTVNADPIGFGESTRPAQIGEAQFKWLDSELKEAAKPVIACGHHGLKGSGIDLAAHFLDASSCKAYLHGHWHSWTPGFTRIPGRGIFPSIGFPSTGHWGDIGFALMRTFPDHAEVELRQSDLFGESGPGSIGGFRNAVLKDRKGATVTIPFRDTMPGGEGRDLWIGMEESATLVFPEAQR